MPPVTTAIETRAPSGQFLRMGNKFTYALILTLSTAVLNLLLYFTGFQTEKLATGQYFQWLGFVIMFVVLWLGISAVRDEKPEYGMSYGRALGTGVLISLISSLMSAVYIYVHFKFINTEFADYQMAFVREQWAAAGVSDAQAEQMEGPTRFFMSPGIQAALTPVLGTILGLVLSLIIAAFVKRRPTVEVPPAM